MVDKVRIGLFFIARIDEMDRLTAVRVFVEVADRGSLTQAADHLEMSAAMVSRYLAAAVSDPSLYETHEEFVARSGSLRNLSETARDACHRGLADLAAVKYAPADAAVAPATLLAGARELLETLHHGFTD